MVDKLRNDINIELANQLVSITNETEARIHLESILSAAIIQEQVNRVTAVDVLTATVEENTTSITQETDNRVSALSGEVANRASAVSALTASISTETANRMTDTNLLTTAVEEVQNSNIGNYVKKNRTYITSIDSGSYIDLDLDGMNITPPAGTYKVDFSCWIENDEKKDDDGLEIALCLDDVLIESSKRRQWTGEAGKYETSIHTQAVVTVSGTQQIKVKAYRLGGDSIRIRQRSIIAIYIGSSI